MSKFVILMISGAKTSLSLQKNQPKVIKPNKYGLSSTWNINAPKSQIINNDNLNLIIEEDENDEIRIRLRNEDIFDTIMDKILNVPIEQALEGPLKQLFNCSICIFWIDMPNDMVLYSPSHDLTVGLSNSIVGCARLAQSVIQIQNQQQCPPNFIIDASLNIPENSKHLFFPVSSSDTVHGVIQITRTPDMPAFSDNDLDSVTFVMNKFLLVGNCIFNTSNLCNMSLSFFQQKRQQSIRILDVVEKYFQCKSAELWKYDLSDMYFFFDRQTGQLNQIESSEYGIIGQSLSTNSVINERMASSNQSFSAPFDGNIDGPILVVPYEKNKREIWCLALRGRSRSFNVYDEREVMSIMPFIVRAAVNNSSNGEDMVTVLTSLLDASSRLVCRLNFSEVIDSIQKQSGQLIECEKAVVLLADKKKEFFTRGSDFIYEGELQSDAKIPIGKGIASICFKEKRILNVLSPKSEADFCKEVDCCVPDLEPSTMLAVPILDLHDESVGVLLLYNKDSGSKFSETDENLATSFNVFAGIALENAKQYRVCCDFSNKLIQFVNNSLMISKKEVEEEVHFDSKDFLSDLMGKALDVTFCDRITLFIKKSVDDFIPIINVGCESNFGSIYVCEAAEKKSPLFLKSEKLDSKSSNNDPKDRSSIKMNNQPKSSLISGFFSQNKSTNYKFKNDSDENLYVYPIKSDDLSVVGVIEYHFYNGCSDHELNFFNAFGSLCELFFPRLNLTQMKSLGYVDFGVDEVMDEGERLTYKTPFKLQIESGSSSSSLFSLSFDVDSLDEIELFKVVFACFEKLELNESFEISNEKLFHFLRGVRELHKNVNPQSWRKAVDSVHFVTYMVIEGGIDKVCSKDQIFAILICSICGSLNDFSEDDDQLLSQNCDYSEIENCAKFLSILCDDESSLLSKLSSSQSKPILEMVVDLILSLDMSLHFTILNDFVNLLNSGDLNLEKSPVHKLLLMKVVAKCGDISLISKPFEIAEKSINYVAEGFFRKGEIERANGVVFESSASKRDEIKLPESLVGFMKSVALPLFQALVKQFASLSSVVQQVTDNIVKYEKMIRTKK